jgi:hypothetical protein
MFGTASPRQALAYLGNLGSSLPGAVAQHRGNFFWKRASGAEDELYAGVKDASGVNQLRRIVTTTLGSTLYALLTGAAFTGNVSTTGTLTVNGSIRDNSGTYTATEGTGMGSSPGAQTKLGNEYCGRIQQDTGTGTTAAGSLWDIAFQNNRANSSYVVVLNPHNTASATIQPFCSSVANTGFTIDCVGDPPDSTQMDVAWFIVDRA